MFSVDISFAVIRPVTSDDDRVRYGKRVCRQSNDDSTTKPDVISTSHVAKRQFDLLRDLYIARSGTFRGSGIFQLNKRSCHNTILKIKCWDLPSIFISFRFSDRYESRAVRKEKQMLMSQNLKF